MYYVKFKICGKEQDTLVKAEDSDEARQKVEKSLRFIAVRAEPSDPAVDQLKKIFGIFD